MPDSIQYQTIAGRRVYSLSELGQSLQSVIAKSYSNLYLLKAEIVSLNHHKTGGHCFPLLIEKEGNKLLAKFNGIIWNSDFIEINRNFINITGEKLADGMQILFEAKVTFDPQYGLTLRIQSIEPSYTLGEMHLAKQIAFKKLQDEGLLNLNKNQHLEILPKNIAIISAETAKGYFDFLTILNNYKSKYSIKTTLYPAVLQGNNAVESIKRKLKEIILSKIKYDAVVIVRGGDDGVGLDCYNSFELSKAVAEMPLPVLTGIGHSPNETLCETVAYKNLITPTDTAYFIISNFINFENNINFLSQKISSSAKELLRKTETNLNDFSNAVILETKKLHVFYSNQLNNTEADLKSRVQLQISNQRHDLFSTQIVLKQSTKHLFNTRKETMIRIEEKVRLLDPINVLKRGYSILYANGKAIQSVNEIKTGESLHSKLFDGEIWSTITELKKGSGEKPNTKTNKKLKK